MKPSPPYLLRTLLALAVWLVVAPGEAALGFSPYVGITGGGTLTYDYGDDVLFYLSGGAYEPPDDGRGAMTGTAFAGIQFFPELALEVESGRSALNHNWEVAWTGAYLVVGGAGVDELDGGGGYIKMGPVRTRSNVRGKVLRDNKFAFGGGVVIPMNKWLRGRGEIVLMDFAGMPRHTVVIMMHLGLVVSAW